MAMMKIVCGGCGGALAPEHTTCPHCGSPVERPIAVGVAEGNRERCKSCGHQNLRGAVFCESCGIRIAGGGPAAKDKKKQSLNPIHLPAVVAALLFSGWALYDDLGREIPDLPDHDHVAETPAPVNSALLQEIRELRRMVEAHPEDDGMVLRLANVLQDYSSQDHQYLHQAAETYERYLKRKPGDENARVDLAICYFDLARHDSAQGESLLNRAIAEMKSVAEGNPKHQPAAFNLGIVMLNAGRAMESTEWFRRAAAIDPTSSLGVRATQLLEDHTFRNN